MSFNQLVLLLFLCLACGVKNDPVAPKSDTLPSILDNYSDIQTDAPINDYKTKP